METKNDYTTNQTKALTVAQPLTPAVWDMIMAISTATEESKQFAVRKPEEVAIKMLVAYERGIPLTSALSAVYVIDHKPTLAPSLLWGLVQASPHFGGYEEERLEKNGAFFGWRITLRRKDGTQATRSFTLDDATRAGLINKRNWQTYPEDVCYWRTIARAIKAVFADVAEGLYTSEELGADITPAGDVIAGEWVTVETMAPTPTPTPEPETSKYATLDELAARWTVDEIVAANDGAIPGTSEQCQAVAEKLESEAGS